MFLCPSDIDIERHLHTEQEKMQASCYLKAGDRTQCIEYEEIKEEQEIHEETSNGNSDESLPTYLC
jgi:hypothetical protein